MLTDGGCNRGRPKRAPTAAVMATVRRGATVAKISRLTGVVGLRGEPRPKEQRRTSPARHLQRAGERANECNWLCMSNALGKSRALQRFSPSTNAASSSAAAGVARSPPRALGGPLWDYVRPGVGPNVGPVVAVSAPPTPAENGSDSGSSGSCSSSRCARNARGPGDRPKQQRVRLQNRV